MKQGRRCNQFSSFMSEPYLSTRSMTCMRLKKAKVFPSLRRPEPHFRDPQGHRGAGVLAGSTNIFWSTIIRVYEVDYQKTVNKKTWKTDYLFSEEIKDIYHYFQEKKPRRQKETEDTVAILSQSLSIDITKTYG